MGVLSLADSLAGDHKKNSLHYGVTCEMHPEVTFAFKDGKTYAIHQGKVIAADADSDVVEASVREAFGQPQVTEMPPPPADLGMETAEGLPGAQMGGQDQCQSCGGQVDPQTGLCLDCGQPAEAMPHPGVEGHPLGLGAEAPSQYDGGYAQARTVVTPNGLKGTVLGKVAHLWGDEVTIRLENGRIVQLPVGTEVNDVPVEKTASTNPLEQFEHRLAAQVDGTVESLEARRQELESIKGKAADLIIEGASDADSAKLDEIVVTADAERQEVEDALTHLADETTRAFEAPAPFRTDVVEQESVNGFDGSWLDQVTNDMIAEAEAQDFGKLMDEGPEAFTAELPDSAIADTGVTRDLAQDFVSAKTAGTDPDVREMYMRTFIARVEECRQGELKNRKETTHKEAAVEKDEFTDLPDEHFFV